MNFDWSERASARKCIRNLHVIFEEEKHLQLTDCWESISDPITYPLCESLGIKFEPNGLRGVFTKIKLTKGQIIGEYVGEFITKKSIVKDRLKNSEDTYIIQLSSSLWLDGQYNGNILTLINHSCNNNNCKLIRLTPSKVGILVIKDVLIGEFLHYNYNCEFLMPYNLSKKCLCSIDCPNYIG